MTLTIPVSHALLDYGCLNRLSERHTSLTTVAEETLATTVVFGALELALALCAFVHEIIAWRRTDRYVQQQALDIQSTCCHLKFRTYLNNFLDAYRILYPEGTNSLEINTVEKMLSDSPIPNEN